MKEREEKAEHAGWRKKGKYRKKGWFKGRLAPKNILVDRPGVKSIPVCCSSHVPKRHSFLTNSRDKPERPAQRVNEGRQLGQIRSEASSSPQGQVSQYRKFILCLLSAEKNKEEGARLRAHEETKQVKEKPPAQDR